jgi:hypothetical protein
VSGYVCACRHIGNAYVRRECFAGDRLAYSDDMGFASDEEALAFLESGACEGDEE